MFDNDEIRKRLIAYIVNNPISINELSQKIHMHYNTLKKFLDGEKARVKTLAVLSKFLKDNE